MKNSSNNLLFQPCPQVYEMRYTDNLPNAYQNPEPKQSSYTADLLYAANKMNRNNLEDLEGNEADDDFASKYSDDTYPSILANFKIKSRLKFDRLRGNKRVVPQPEDISKMHSKRDTHQVSENSQERSQRDSGESKKYNRITNDKIAQLKSTLDKLQQTDSLQNVENIEENLKDILEDMGLMGDSEEADNLKSKRENIDNNQVIDIEDENLENGLNKIELTKNNHEADRDKRSSEEKENKQTKNIESAKHTNNKLTSSKNAKPKFDFENNDDAASDEDIIQKDLNAANKDILGTFKLHGDNQEGLKSKRDIQHLKPANYEAEGENFIRSKRQKEKNVKETSAASGENIMQGLEKSGELTVSGNKSPLATANNVDSKQTDENKLRETTKMENESLNEEARVEREIQAKIDAIKEEVKREISKLQSSGELAPSPTEATETGRKKRGVNSLLDEETQELDPAKISENSLQPLRRRKRNTDESKLNKIEANGDQPAKIETRSYDTLKIKDNAKITAALGEGMSKYEESENKAADLEANQNELNSNSIQPLEAADENESRNRQRRQTFGGRQNMYDRRKRTKSMHAPENLGYRSFREEDEEIDDEGDEFDDDSFDDRTAAIVRRRRYDVPLDDQQNYRSNENAEYQNYENDNQGPDKRSTNEENEDNPSANNDEGYGYESDPNFERTKRQYFDQNVALHGGSTAVKHLAAIRQRNLQDIPISRQKRYYQESLNDDIMGDRPQQIADMSDTDLFGPLPQSYEGELARFKRVKRKHE